MISKIGQWRFLLEQPGTAAAAAAADYQELYEFKAKYLATKQRQKQVPSLAANHPRED